MFRHPFESQPGSKYVLDHLQHVPGQVPLAGLPLNATVEAGLRNHHRRGVQVRIRRPQSSKFRDYPMQL